MKLSLIFPIQRSCAVYSMSLIVLYTSSTLYHSFFALRYTRYIFESLDHCAIYILIAGTYTPIFSIALNNERVSLYMICFIWLCCILGVYVELAHSTWEHKGKFSLSMYVGMGWVCVVGMPKLMQVLPIESIHLIFLGGIAYMGGVPFFVRNNDLDHSIWHLFVLVGSVIHWLCVYWYVASLII